MDESNLVFMIRVNSTLAPNVVIDCETYALIPVPDETGFMDIYIGPKEKFWLENQCDFDR